LIQRVIRSGEGQRAPAGNDRIVLYRFLISTLVFGTALGLLLAGSDGRLTPPAAGMLVPLTVGVLLTVLYLSLIVRFPTLRGARWFTAVQYVIDTAVLTVPIALTEGTSSPFLGLFVLVVVAAAMTHSTRFSFTIALLAAACLSAVTWMEIHGRLPGVTVPQQPEEIGRILLRVAIYIGSFTLVGVLAGRLVERLRRTDQALAYTRRDFGFLREQYRVIVEQVPSGIALLDEGGNLLLLNRSGQRILDSLGPEGRRGLLAELVAAVDAGGPIERAVDFADGQHLLGASATRLDPEAGFGGTLVIFQDVTERRQLEADLAEQGRLASIGELSASLAHELRNPLAAVANSMQMLGELPELPPSERRLLEIMRTELARLEQLVADFLRYARPRPAEPVPVRLDALVQAVVDGVRHHPGASDCRIVIKAEAGPPVMLDPELFRQALGNLLLNALQWASRPDGQVQVRVAAATEGPAIVQVIDNGPGIAPDDTPHVFEPFWSRREGGTGLGLAIAWSAAQRMGGGLQIRASRPGETVFELSVPIQSAGEEYA
jgi:two-component system sensor histidine kinase PilS (NtrC family)